MISKMVEENKHFKICARNRHKENNYLKDYF